MVACQGSSRPSLSLVLYSINLLFHHSFGARLYNNNLIFISILLFQSMDVMKVDPQAFEFFVNPIQSQNLQIWQGYHLSIFKSYVFLQNLEGIAQELNMRLLGYCGRWISHEGPLQGSGTSIIPNSDPPSSLSSRTTLLVPVLVERFPYLQLPAGAEFLNNGTLYPSMKAANKTRQDKKRQDKTLDP